MGEGHHAAIGGTDADDRPKAQVPAQRLHVLDVLVERVLGGVAARRAALTAVVEIDELHALGERRHHRLEAAVIAAGAAVDHKGDRLLAHDAAIRHQPHAFDIEVDLGIAELGAHPLALT